MNFLIVGPHVLNADRIHLVRVETKAARTLARVTLGGSSMNPDVTLSGAEAEAFLAWVRADATDLTPEPVPA